jgi:serine/threonine protein kinase
MERTLISNFQNEAVALDRVRHPNIINRLGHGTAIDLAGTTFHYIVLEYLPGGDMAALSRHHPLTIDKAIFYLEQVCSGLAHAHKCGVIHRDVKPQNLLLTADKKIIKIADFGVARLEATEGAITRVGTNVYAPPEHNPLVQTGQLDLDTLGATRERQLTPAADVYSLAKTTYSLLAGESPRRFAHHAVTSLPETMASEYWARPILRVLEKATQRLPEERQQSVEEFWDDLAEAALRPTAPLDKAHAYNMRKPSEELELEPEEFTKAPPQARFEPVAIVAPTSPANDSLRRARIVVPVKQLDRSAEAMLPRQSAKDIVAAFPDRQVNGRQLNGRRLPLPEVPASRTRTLLVAAALVMAFSGMLLATHKYVTSHWNPLADIPMFGDRFIVGREGQTTTDVNLRPDASTANSPVGLAENGSRVKILSSDNNWYEVQVMEHGRPKTDPFSADRGWINKKFVKFE